MEYSLQIDLAICLNTEYVWTRRTKNEECSLECSSFLLCCDGVREHHIQKLTHHRTAVFERRNIRSVCYDFALQNCLNTECVSTKESRYMRNINQKHP